MLIRMQVSGVDLQKTFEWESFGGESEARWPGQGLLEGYAKREVLSLSHKKGKYPKSRDSSVLLSLRHRLICSNYLADKLDRRGSAACVV